MNTQPLGTSSLITTRLAYGTMRVSGTWDPAAFTPDHEASGRRALLAAYEAGYILFDHADIYGRGLCESIHGRVMRDVPEMRSRILIATKCGIRFAGDPTGDAPHRYDFSAKHILWSCEQSLKRLQTDAIDLYQLHRPDVLMNPPEIAQAFAQLKRQGKVREFGVSNFRPSFLSALQKHCPMPLIVNQIEIHLARLDPFDDGTLDQCLEQSITPLAWSPLGGGFLGAGGKVDKKHPRRDELLALQTTLDEVATKYDVSRTVIALAWLLKHPSRIIPIIGSTNPDHLRDATKADKIELSRQDWYRVLLAARGKALP
ncbi:MAG: aldo/keto reductase [Tepidisphaeraceae bacterium]